MKRGIEFDDSANARGPYFVTLFWKGNFSSLCGFFKNCFRATMIRQNERREIMANLSSHGVLLVAAGSILWGSSGIAGQYILQGQGISPEWLTFFRLFVAGSLLLLISHLMGKGIVSV
jgi:hypothetical protein